MSDEIQMTHYVGDSCPGGHELTTEDRYVARIAAQRAAWEKLRSFIFKSQSYSLGDLVEYNVELIQEVDAAFDFGYVPDQHLSQQEEE